MPSVGKGRSNYCIDPVGVVRARGYGIGRYSKVRILWDATREGDLGFSVVEYDGVDPIAHGELTSFIEGLNSGRIEDRFA